MNKPIKIAKENPKRKTSQKNASKSLDKLYHDVRGSLTVMKVNVDLFEISPEYKNDPEKVSDLLETINKEISKIIDKLK